MLNNNKHSLRSVIRKVLAAFLLVSVAIFLALAIARFSFRELMGTVDELSEPNEKLILLNHLFENITTLDQLQRAEAIRNPNKPYRTFLNQSASINTMIDSLTTFDWDTAQVNRLGEMKTILAERNKLFFSYLKVKAKLLDNREFSDQLDTLTAILQDDKLTIDSSFISQQTKTTTTYLQDSITLASKKDDQRSFLKRLFSKRKEDTPVDTPLIRVREETAMVVDTLAVARQNQAVKEIEKIMREMESDQRSQRRNLQTQELELIHANSLFINQLLGVLHEVENEELALIEYRNSHAVRVMNQSLSRINILMLSFFIAAALLIYLIWIDIGRSNYYKEQLEKARDEAEELSKIKQRFLANMSHEIRTPLQSIIGFAEQLKQKTGSHHEELGAIYSSSEHLLHIVNEVLDYSRISSGHFTLAKEKFRLLSLVKEVESAMRVQAEAKNLTFILDAEKSSEYLLSGDPFRLRQILYNLIGNAVKFTHRGFIKLAVKTIDEGEQVRAVFEIIDTGIGINQDDLNKIFNQFEQVETSVIKQYGGTGLGLTIVKSLVEAQRGELEVASEPGIGSSFRVELVFEKAVAGPVSKIHFDKKPPRNTLTGQVLVIDDDPLILRLCGLILEKHEVRFHAFNNAKAAMAFESPDPVSHAFLDIRMPDMNGVDLCHELKEKYSMNIQCIALTAHVLPDERASLLHDGFDAVLPKPFHENEMLNILGLLSHEDVPVHDEQPDLSTLRKMTMGDDALFHSIVLQFVEETTEDILQVNEKIERQETGDLREIIHKMSGRFAQLGMLALGGKLHAIEKKLIAGHRIDELTSEIGNAIARVNETILHIRLVTLAQFH